MHWLTKRQFAERTGASVSAVRLACAPGRALDPAVSPDRRRIDTEHDAARIYVSRLNRECGHRRPKSANVEPSSVGAGVGSAGGEDPTPDTLQALSDIRRESEGRLPSDLGDLGAMTLREACERCGDLVGLKDLTASLKNYAAMQNTESIAATRRGVHVDRRLIPMVFVPLVNLAFKRCVEDVPEALADQAIARVLSGGDGTRLDVVALIRRELSSTLGECVEATKRAVQEHATE